jgi:hypothetical protein
MGHSAYGVPHLLGVVQQAHAEKAVVGVAFGAQLHSRHGAVKIWAAESWRYEGCKGAEWLYK